MKGPLDGLRVLDVSTVLAGPLTAQLLGDYGADVIKIEHPKVGDTMRGHGKQRNGHGLWWKMLARNKRCLGLYLGDPEGAEIFKQLVADSDVVIENFRPGTLERWGLGPEELHRINPRLVLVRISGWGQTGPYAHRPGFGTLAEAMSGFAAITGEPDGPPTLPPFGLADSICALAACSATVMALYHRDTRGGGGQVIDLSIIEPIITVLGAQPTIFDQLGELQPRTGNRSDSNAPRNTYRTKDGRWVALSSAATSIAERVMHLVGHPEVIDEPWFKTGIGRAQHDDLLDRYVAEWIGERTRDEVIAAFEAADAAIAPVYAVDELMEDPQIRALDTITTVDDPDLGPIKMQNVIARMSETPGSIRSTGRALGADTDEIMGELGISPSRVTELKERGVLG